MLLHMLNKRLEIVHLFGNQILIEYKHFLFVNNFIISETLSFHRFEINKFEFC